MKLFLILTKPSMLYQYLTVHNIDKQSKMTILSTKK